MAAAEGTVGTRCAEVLCARLGLSSWLFLRDLVTLELEVMPGLSGGRIGEVSREGFGDVTADVVAEGRGVVNARFNGRNDVVEERRCGSGLAVPPPPTPGPLLLLITASFASGWLAVPGF